MIKSTGRERSILLMMNRVKTRDEASIVLDRICMLDCVLLVEIQTWALFAMLKKQIKILFRLIYYERKILFRLTRQAKKYGLEEKPTCPLSRSCVDSTSTVRLSTRAAAATGVVDSSSLPACSRTDAPWVHTAFVSPVAAVGQGPQGLDRGHGSELLLLPHDRLQVIMLDCWVYASASYARACSTRLTVTAKIIAAMCARTAARDGAR